MSAVGQEPQPSVGRREPVLTAAGGLAAVGGPLGYGATTQAGGWVQVLATILPVVLPLLVAWFTRMFTRPTVSSVPIVTPPL